MSGPDFVTRSRAAFADYFPGVMAGVNQRSSVESSVVFESGDPVDIRVDGRLIYGGDARQFAAGQVDAYMKKPLRFLLQRLDLCGMITPCGWRLVRTIDGALRGGGFGESTTQPTNSPTLLVVLGLGLGHHIEKLVRETQPKWLLIVEPLVEFIEHSFHAVDWAALIENFKEKGGQIAFVTESDPPKIIRAISAMVQAKGAPYADGSWVFTHYPFWAFNEVRDNIHKAMEFVFINRGYYEDELVMFGNSVRNFAKHDCWLLENRPHLQRPELAVIVGAGPSLDEGIETIKAIRDRVVLFSAGTALRALLRNGITPDFHCEVENGGPVYDVLVETAKCGDLSKITLIAANTVYPSVPSLFGETIFYFRDSVSPTQIIGRKHLEIYGTSPTCVNLAMTSAAVMGFTDFALFGTDCGTRPGSLRHAQGTIYSDIAKYQNANEPTKSHTMEVPGNFGGIIHTELVYDSCRIMLGETIRFYGSRVFNCSDGALIPGAQPCVPEALQVNQPVIDRAVFRTQLRRAMQKYPAGKLLEEADLENIRRLTETMFADLDKLLVELGDGDADFAAAYDRIMTFVNEAKDTYGFTESIVSGSLQALPRIAMFYGFRLAEAHGRRRLFDLFIAEFRAIANDMAKDIFKLFDGLEDEVQASRKHLAATGAS